MTRLFLMLGAVSAAIAVAAGAFGAHALRSRLDARMLDAFETGARYQMYHALALFAVAWLVARAASAAPGTTTLATAAGWLLVAGTVLFSGSLYAMALTGVRGLGAVTPLGGACFLAGWACLAAAAARGPR
jgi:uncharacterized membrane protein YgdD (TMEM256/DUF423 family)